MKIRQMISKFGIYIILVIMIVFFSFASDVFLTTDNIFNILRQVAVVGIGAVGMNFVILTGGIDLSTGAIIGVTGIVTAKLMISGVNPVIAFLLGLLAAILMGFINALIVTELKIMPLIATLGTCTSLRGLAYYITGGLPVYGFPESFTVLGQGYVGIIPVPVIIMAVIFVIGSLVLSKFTIGRYIYGIGGNEEASRLSGVNIKRTKYLVYTISGFLSGLAGIVLLSRTNSAQPIAGTGYEMDMITAVVLGGVSIAGGEGKLTGTIAGVLIMGILSNGMLITNVGDYVQRMIQGLVLIAAVAFDIYNQRRKANVKELTLV